MNNEFNVLSKFINIIMILLVEGVIIPLSFIVFIFPIFDVVYKYIISGFLYLNKIISLFCYKIGFVINIGSISEYYIFVYYLLVILLIIFINKKRIFSFIICLLSCFLLVIIFNISIIPKKEITFLDLYNGESTLIEYKNEIILIDCGEGINNEVTSFLKTKGIRKIDYLILTHNHSDHNGEALNIVKNFRVKNIVVSIYDNSIYSKYDNVNKIKKGDIIKTKFIDIYCLSPYQSSNNENNNSLVLYFIIDEIRFLFTGDIELEIEEELPKLEVDVLKVAHHGSITSSSTSFLNKIRPKYSVIMSGRSNIYEFPNDNIINRLDNINGKVYCTRDCYSIILKISCFGKMKWHTLKKPITFN